MHSSLESNFSMLASVAAPVAVLGRRQLRLPFPLPHHFLRALGHNEVSDSGMWSSWLADWGWAWAISSESCGPKLPLTNLWLDRGASPAGFEPRSLALAVALQIRVDGKPLRTGPETISFDLSRVWSKVSSLSKDELGEVLALALLRAESTIFHFDSIAPSWPSDVGRVIAERRSLSDERSPSPVWLKHGYALLGDGFDMLRSMGTTVESSQEVWDALSPEDELPMAFKMAFWWEATYCFTERHAYDDAEAAQTRVAQLAHALERMTGLVDPMWHHQQGRLYYYSGNHELALAEFLREYKNRKSDLTVAAMLNREIANVLSDMTCFEAGRNFAETSVAAARSQGQQSELYKSLGRLAEINIKLGHLAAAEESLIESISIQEKLSGENPSPGQTLTYLGHLAILNGDFDKALELYDRAEAKDVNKSSLPYIMMGRFSLAAATGNAVQLEQLWNAHREILEKWATHQTQVLPAAVCILAAARSISLARARLPFFIRSLIENRYVVEAVLALPHVNESDQSRMIGDIVSMLNRWHKTLASLPPEIQEMAGALNGPKNMVDWINQLKTGVNNQQRSDCCYPMSLLVRVGED